MPGPVGTGKDWRDRADVDRRVVVERYQAGAGLGASVGLGAHGGNNRARAAVCAGSGGAFLDDALNGNAELYLTGEIRHHDAIKATGAGMTIICTLHSNSERAVLKRVHALNCNFCTGRFPYGSAASSRDHFRGDVKKKEGRRNHF